MRRFYKVLFDEQPDLGVAQTLAERDLFFLPYSGRVSDWQPPTLELRDGGYPDYLASTLGCRLCSDKLRSILDAHAGPADELQWLPVRVRSGRQERPFFVLHFPSPPDVLDKTETIFAGSFVVKAVLSDSAVADYRVFGYPECGELPLLIAEDVKIAIERERCTGMEMAPVPVT